jgi:creatinine amidohydrolase
MGVMLDSARTSWPEIEAARGVIALLPVGALEQHGAHLPLDTDTVLATGVARRIAAEIGGWLLPAIGYGEAWSAEGWPGTISLSAETLQRSIEDIARGLRRIGVAGLVTINGHFGNRAPIAAAAYPLPALHLDYPGLEDAAAEFCASKPAGPSFYHADEVETSMMLALAPDAVRLDRAVSEYPVFPSDFGTRPMQLREFNSSGVFGDPRPATAATGEKIIARIVNESIALIERWRAAL